ncbi:hypothetical protein ACJMK2_022633 [Sinanodonta woodiana]|uniref:Transient receptor potential cation channel subfamily M member 3 n=1 Tax=Sinanodonta woodiana TaxID=1069815 RepID=A0ABD3TL18_SINWO
MSESMCQCGYPIHDHDKAAMDHPKQDLQSQTDTLQWTSDQHTVSTQTNAFGEIEFVGFNGNAKVRYIKDAWIITGGTHVGVAKYVGEAVKYSRFNSDDHRDIVTIGIAPWGVIHNKHLLVNTKRSTPIEYRIEDKPNDQERFLNPNHSHFILVDNGTQHQLETETAIRATLECTTCRKYGNDFNTIPAVLLVIDGGRRILKTIINALSKNIPVVIVKGSGRVADLLADALKNAEESDFIGKDDMENEIKKIRKSLTDNQRRKMHDKMMSIKFCEEKDIDTNIKEIEACLDKFWLINIFELGGGDEDLYNTMFFAVLRGPDRLNDIMVSAIESNNVEFVELLIENGVNIETFVTVRRLKTLYNGMKVWKLSYLIIYYSISLHFRMSCYCTSTEQQINMKEVGILITHLLDDHYIEQYRTKKGNHLPKNATFENPFLHLLIWAVLNNLQNMAKLFWSKGMDSIAAALLAHALFSAMKSKIKNATSNLYEELEDNSREFMGFATEVVDIFYRTYENDAHDLLVGELSSWEKASCILIAMKLKNQTFISATPCQEVFNTVWMGEMTQDNGILKLLLCMLFPPLIPLCVNFKDNTDNESDPDDDTTSETVQEDQDQSTGESSPDVSVQQKETKLKYCSKAKNNIQHFYGAPVVKFLFHAISYMAFLCLYSYILISKFDQNCSVEDVVLILWVAHIFIEEIIQVIATRYIYNEIKLKAYIADFWNIADILMIVLFVIGMILKHLHCPNTLEAARIVLGINLITFFLRLLQIFSLSKELGPKLVMIIRMVRNLTSFFVMLIIFIVAYAIASQAILYPNTEISFNLLWVIFRRPYWNIYGELMLDEIEGTNDCTNILELYINGTQPRCPTDSGKYAVPVLMGMYMLMCNILLLNLLISIFSNTYQKVEDNADMHWRVQRYHQIQEYITRPLFVPFYLVDVLCLKRFRCRYKPENDGSETNVFYRQVVREREMSIAQIIINNKQADLESIDNSVTAIHKRLEKMDSKIDTLQEQQHTGTATNENPQLGRGQTEFPTESESITGEPGPVTSDQMTGNIEQKLKWIVDTLKKYKPGAKQASPEKNVDRVEEYVR